MIKRKDDIDRLGGQVLCVAYDETSLLHAKMLHDLPMPFPLLLDRDKRAYQRWGMGRAGLTSAMLSPTLNFRYVKLLASGERFLGLAPDMLQLGGDFVVAADGTLSFVHRMKNNGDRAAVRTLISELWAAAQRLKGYGV